MKTHDNSTVGLGLIRNDAKLVPQYTRHEASCNLSLSLSLLPSKNSTSFTYTCTHSFTHSLDSAGSVWRSVCGPPIRTCPPPAFCTPIGHMPCCKDRNSDAKIDFNRQSSKFDTIGMIQLVGHPLLVAQLDNCVTTTSRAQRTAVKFHGQFECSG